MGDPLKLLDALKTSFLDAGHPSDQKLRARLVTNNRPVE